MEKHFCDICNKQFKWYNSVFRILNQYGESPETLEICSKCNNKIWVFIAKLKKELKCK